MWTRRQNQQPTQAQLGAEDAIVATLRGGDTLPAWNAIWDLVQSTDSQGKQQLLDALRGYVTTAASADDAATASNFADAIDQAMRAPGVRRQTLPSKEVREQYKRDQIAAHRDAMQAIGVREGEGLPMWAIYMTRRSKRSWG